MIIKQVYKNLWQGASLNLAKNKSAINKFDLLVLLNSQPRLSWFGGDILRAPISNSPNPTEWERMTANRIIAAVDDWIKRGRQVLITCNSWECSSFIVGCTLRYTFGFSPDKSVQIVRKVCGADAFNNALFEHVVRTMKWPFGKSLQKAQNLGNYADRCIEAIAWLDEDYSTRLEDLRGYMNNEGWTDDDEWKGLLICLEELRRRQER